MELVTYKVEDVNKVLDYLSMSPYREVVELIYLLQQKQVVPDKDKQQKK